MPSTSPSFVSCDPEPDPAAAHTLLVDELQRGLMAPTAQVSPKFFYDKLGSLLFSAITELPEYYPTRTEAAILAERGGEIAARVRQQLPGGFGMVDLGAGDGAKAARLFSALQPGRYVGIDISQDFLRQSLAALQDRFPAIRMVGVGLDFSKRLQLPPGLLDGPALVFYPGSSIGNFAPVEALRLLREAHALCNGGALLIGADLIKPAAVLQAAYDDALGVTAAFNLNLLRHVNGVLGSDFDVHQWQHVALFNAGESRVEMHLEARHDTTVTWPGGARRFAAGERIHTENSAKWTPGSFEALLRDAGWRDVQRWTDAQGWFGVFLARG
jgi:dimethylhistidine N-methyltransferase